MPTLMGAAERIISPVGRPAAALLGSARRTREGLRAPTNRRDFLLSLPAHGEVLEIGPFDAPQVQGDRVAYFDVMDREGLQRRAAQEKRNPPGCPHIDYVSPHGDLSIVDRRFDAVFSSHVIEHQHDLVRHLEDVHRLLRPGGAYYVIAPDKRYMFDHYLPESRLEEVVFAHERDAQPNVERALWRHYHDLAHNRPFRHWIGLHGEPETDPRNADAHAEADIAATRAGEYRDVHCWHFTPASFLSIMRDLAAAGAIPLKPSRVHDTMFGEPEFFAVLGSADAS